MCVLKHEHGEYATVLFFVKIICFTLGSLVSEVFTLRCFVCLPPWHLGGEEKGTKQMFVVDCNHEPEAEAFMVLRTWLGILR